jgi:hypothetical protein
MAMAHELRIATASRNSIPAATKGEAALGVVE